MEDDFGGEGGQLPIYSDTTDQVAWNLSAGITEEIRELLVMADRQYLTGHISKAFFTLKNVKFRFIQNLTKKERESLVKLELSFFKGRKQYPRSSYYFERYNEKIMDLLDSYGYLVPKKKDTRRMG